MNYREICWEDLPAMTALYIDAFNAEPWRDTWTEETASKRLRQMMQRDSCYGLLAYEDDELCGLVLGDEEQFCDGVEFQIREFCVDNSKRGRGLGTLLYQQLEQRLRQRGIYEIILYTLRHPKAEGFYQRQGFSTSTDIVFMSKRLDETSE